MGGHAVYFGIGGHDGCGVGFLYAEAKGLHVKLTQGAFRKIGRGLVDAAFRLSVTGKMFERGGDMPGGDGAVAAALETSYHGAAHHTAEVGVFAKGFAGASPARVAAYIDYRRQHQ